MGEGAWLALSSAVGSASSLRDSVLLELETTVAARVGFATCSMNCKKLCVSLISSGRDSMTAERERIPFFTGKCGIDWCEAVLGGGEILPEEAEC